MRNIVARNNSIARLKVTGAGIRRMKLYTMFANERWGYINSAFVKTTVSE